MFFSNRNDNPKQPETQNQNRNFFQAIRSRVGHLLAIPGDILEATFATIKSIPEYCGYIGRKLTFSDEVPEKGFDGLFNPLGIFEVVLSRLNSALNPLCDPNNSKSVTAVMEKAYNKEVQINHGRNTPRFVPTVQRYADHINNQDELRNNNPIVWTDLILGKGDKSNDMERY